MDKFVQVECVYDPVICFALQQNRVPPIKSIILENLTHEAKHRHKLSITANPPFLEPHVIHIDQLDAQEKIEIHPQMDLSAMAPNWKRSWPLVTIIALCYRSTRIREITKDYQYDFTSTGIRENRPFCRRKNGSAECRPQPINPVGHRYILFGDVLE